MNTDSMSPRDWFAASFDCEADALFRQMTTAARERLVGHDAPKLPERNRTAAEEIAAAAWYAECTAAIRYMLADAMLARRQREAL